MKECSRVLYKGAEASITEKKSRFIATSFPVKTEEEAEAFIEKIRKKYYDARHNCYAYVLGEKARITRMSDDGEPSQTAGLPILNVLLGTGTVDACIVVTRYFGGTLLGTGGLFRAYTKAAEKVLEASVIVEKNMAELWCIQTDYQDLGKIQNAAGNLGLCMLDSRYTDKVELDLLVPLSGCEEAGALITEKTGGRAGIRRVRRVPFALTEEGVVLFDEESLAIQNN